MRKPEQCRSILLNYGSTESCNPWSSSLVLPWILVQLERSCFLSCRLICTRERTAVTLQEDRGSRIFLCFSLQVTIFCQGKRRKFRFWEINKNPHWDMQQDRALLTWNEWNYADRLMKPVTFAAQKCQKRYTLKAGEERELKVQNRLKNRCKLGRMHNVCALGRNVGTTIWNVEPVAFKAVCKWNHSFREVFCFLQYRGNKISGYLCSSSKSDRHIQNYLARLLEVKDFPCIIDIPLDFLVFQRYSVSFLKQVWQLPEQCQRFYEHKLIFWNIL